MTVFSLNLLLPRLPAGIMEALRRWTYASGSSLARELPYTFHSACNNLPHLLF
jgi:hypothetical protein